ncbi:LysM peptidoglycan-binding domain-containing protein [Acuticoccus sp. M5D2P5]|uniref:LysM peptidoglycan-binding domain-containing protein n=1 Tax=Acuticoccus kalidii TaxID=2910977 RepID=UPI001F1ED6F4|nr:LysM peptidoglycan-binding domain-containing protein [Acuticoccus kalidii]MCF3933676.1 LysM peptidoglycan-binding domain-containing protein [Acuticoccus kalidii]
MWKSSSLAGAVLVLAMSVPGASAYAAEGPCGASHILERGETFYDVSTRCNVTLSALMMSNPQISNIDSVAPGTEVVIPNPVAGFGDEPLEGSREAAPLAGTRHVVEPGESFASIATLYGTTVTVLETANPGIQEADLRPGASLIIPAAATDGDGNPVATGPSSVEGRLAAGSQCPIVTTAAGEVVGLIGNTQGFRNGDYVRVEGDLAEQNACTQGTRTINVARMFTVDPPLGQ